MNDNRGMLKIVVVAVIIIVTATKIVYALKINHPGHADYSFYYTVAENIASGRGLVIDYVWHYLNGFVPLTHPSNDYWMPATSIIISLFMMLFGTTLQTALLTSIVFSVLVAVATYFISREFSESKFAQLYSTLLVLVCQPLFTYSLTTDSTTYYVLFTMLSLYFMIKGRNNDKYFILASVFAALSYLTRQDGLLLLMLLVAEILLTAAPMRDRQRTTFIVFCAFIISISPYLIYNVLTYGKPLLSASTKTMFITNYEDIYSATKELSLRSYVAWGERNILLSKGQAILSNWQKQEVGVGAGILSFIGLLPVICWTRRKRSVVNWYMYSIPMAYLLMLYLFYSLVATFPGIYAFGRSFAAILPFLIIAAVNQIERYIRTSTLKHLVLVLLTVVCSFNSIAKADEAVFLQNKISLRMTRLGDIIMRDSVAQGETNIVVMTRNPWEFYHSTRIRALQIPNDGLDTIYSIAKKYGTNYLILPGNRPPLGEIYQLQSTDTRFHFIGQISGENLRVFRVT